MESTRNPINITNSEMAQVETYQREIIDIFNKEFSHLEERRNLYTKI